MPDISYLKRKLHYLTIQRDEIANSWWKKRLPWYKSRLIDLKARCADLELKIYTIKNHNGNLLTAINAIEQYSGEITNLAVR